MSQLKRLRAIAELQAKLDDPDYPPKYSRRLITELREECKIHRNSAAGAHNQLRANRLETERLAVDWQAAVAERDTLRQQLAELQEVNRIQLEIATVHGAACVEIRKQRDKLAGLLRDVRPIVALEVERWARAAALLPVNTTVESGLLARIDAALAEVKACTESPHPAAT